MCARKTVFWVSPILVKSFGRLRNFWRLCSSIDIFQVNDLLPFQTGWRVKAAPVFDRLGQDLQVCLIILAPARSTTKLQWKKSSLLDNNKKGRWGWGAAAGHHNFWSFVLDDLWSKKICWPKMIVDVRCYIHLRWSCSPGMPLRSSPAHSMQVNKMRTEMDILVIS